jgi:hypothetical protein
MACAKIGYVKLALAQCATKQLRTIFASDFANEFAVWVLKPLAEQSDTGYDSEIDRFVWLRTM